MTAPIPVEMQTVGDTVEVNSGGGTSPVTPTPTANAGSTTPLPMASHTSICVGFRFCGGKNPTLMQLFLIQGMEE